MSEEEPFWSRLISQGSCLPPHTGGMLQAKCCICMSASVGRRDGEAEVKVLDGSRCCVCVRSTVKFSDAFLHEQLLSSRQPVKEQHPCSNASVERRNLCSHTFCTTSHSPPRQSQPDTLEAPSKHLCQRISNQRSFNILPAASATSSEAGIPSRGQPSSLSSPNIRAAMPKQEFTNGRTHLLSLNGSQSRCMKLFF